MYQCSYNHNIIYCFGEYCIFIIDLIAKKDEFNIRGARKTIQAYDKVITRVQNVQKRS